VNCIFFVHVSCCYQHILLFMLILKFTDKITYNYTYTFQSSFCVLNFMLPTWRPSFVKLRAPYRRLVCLSSEINSVTRNVCECDLYKTTNKAAHPIHQIVETELLYKFMRSSTSHLRVRQPQISWHVVKDQIWLDCNAVEGQETPSRWTSRR
jgi:hypothetical protein